ncbi:hypothetical protein EV401DRAFT_2253975 [Pisolithus croceorrhizus]|nr:hypothetical protein EV401DRAFT_2253975 [Pisolithus croceorrhizus]
MFRVASLVALHAACCIAWSWSNTPRDVESFDGYADSTVHDVQDTLRELSDPELDTIFSGKSIGPLITTARIIFEILADVLGSYHRKADCFQDAMSRVKTRCEESHMDEQERIQAAISMTLCELATARHYAPPMECAAFSKGQQSPSSGHAQAACVEALSRSAQFWSSYSGYLRELPQLCFAFRRWLDVDIAKDVYRNITAEKLALLKFLNEREKDAVTTQQFWVRTNQELGVILRALQTTSDGLQDRSDLISTAINGNLQSFVAEVKSFLKEVQDLGRASHVETITELRRILVDIGREHSEELVALVPSIRSSINSELNTAFGIIKHESLRNLDVADHIHFQLDALADGLGVMHSSVQELIGLVSDTYGSMELFVSQAQSTRVLQEDIHSSMFRLADSVHRLTQTTHDELESINQTTAVLIQNLQRGHDMDWWKSVLFPALRLFFPGILPIGTTTTWPLDLLFNIIDGVWRVLCFSVSMFTSALLVSNTRRWFTRRLKSTDVTCGSSRDANIVMDVSSHAVKLTLDPRLSKRSLRLRYSRIPDRLCKTIDHTAW